MKVRKSKDVSIDLVEAKLSLAIDSLAESAYQLEMICDHLYAKDVDRALRLSRSIQAYLQNLVDTRGELR
mgnify:CR=1 FL=1